ncbi:MULTISPECIES: hypothetical protein [Brevibacillus]|uniref:hypothetical protein n=1 Tax=Brevibacillus TaxID=55080 RepID=UPI0036274B25
MHIEGVSYRDLAMSQLTTEQQDFIMSTMRRGKRSAWLTIMAEIKGIVLSPEDDEEVIARKIGGWILDHFDDLGTRDGKCECGQSLRYVYHVTHIESKDSLSLGSTCIERYTGLDAKTVEAVIKGMKVFDFEKDEILQKVVNNWMLPFDIPSDLVVPTDIQQHFDVGLPLLDRQVSRLKKLILKYRHEQKRSFDQPIPSENGIRRKEIEQGAIDLFSFMEESAITTESATSYKAVVPRNGKGEVPNFNAIPERWKAVIQDKLQEMKRSGETFVTSLQMSNYVAQVFGYDQDRYLTGKPRTYFWVASYMDKLHSLEVVEAYIENIIYRFK